MRLLLLLAALLPSSVLGFSGTGGPARTQTLWLPLTTTPTPGVAAGSAAWTFTRNSIGTYTNSAGVMATAPVNEARFDYDPVTLQALGHLNEGTRVNNTLWSGAGASTPSGSAQFATAVALAVSDMTNTSATYFCIAETADNQQHRYLFPGRARTNGAVTVSIYVKAPGRGWCQLSAADANGQGGYTFNVAGLAVGSAIGSGGTFWTPSSATIAQGPLGWVRVSITMPAAPGAPAIYPQLGFCKSDGTLSYAGDTSASMFFTGLMQENDGAFPSSYVPTTSAPVTRQADGYALANPGAWNDATGTVMCVVDCTAGTDPTFNYRAIVSGSSGLALYRNQATDTVQMYDRTSAVTLPSTMTVRPTRVASTWGPDGQRLYSYSAGVLSSSSGAFDGNMNLAPIVTVASGLFGHVRDVRVWMVQLTAREIATINSALGAP